MRPLSSASIREVLRFLQDDTTGIFWEIQADTMTVDVLNLCIARPSATNALDMQDGQVLACFSTESTCAVPWLKKVQVFLK